MIQNSVDQAAQGPLQRARKILELTGRGKRMLASAGSLGLHLENDTAML